MTPNPPTSQALTPTFTFVGIEFPLEYARQAMDSYAFTEHLGEFEQTTVRWRTNRIEPVPPSMPSGWSRLDVIAEIERVTS